MALNQSDSSNHILDSDFLLKVSSIIKTLGHPERIRIVEKLNIEESTVTEVQESLGIGQSTTSQHLRRMYREGIVTSRRDGNRVFYSIANPLIGKMLACFEELQEERMTTKEMNK
ncbi:MAG: transcriptional regulator [Methanobacteriota archaeon]|jgi:ArsR family transcriptional regulator|nr:MAG: transcriptional regulator [Euryarchaeota archaeon]HIE64134.1 ArsR family transcriptional regulator [Candidatus Poseidoniales archaeon]HIK99696.1 ArsR family transcriptional regulator [Candidatus Poseidoniales archaeon]